MIGTSVKNFFKSICFYFIPLGVMTFFIVLYLASAIPGSINIVKDTFQAISAKVSTVEFNWDQVSGVLLGKFMEYSGDPEKLSLLMSNPDQAMNVLKEVVMQSFGLESVTEEVVALLQNMLTALLFQLIGLLIMVIVGFFAGFVVLEIVLRRFLTNVNMVKAFFISLLNGLLAVGLFVLLGYLNIENLQVAAWIIFIVAILVALLLSLLEAYLFYGIKKVKFIKVFNIKNIFTLLVGNLICIVLCIGITLLCTLIPNMFSRIFVIIPFIELTFCVLELNACSYVAKLAGENKIEKRIQNEIAKKEE